MINKKLSTLNDIDVVVYALFILGGWQMRIHTEDIALKCFELARSKFSWVKYQEYPDLMTVWYALGDAKKERYGSLVIGGSERKKGSGSDISSGWRLTENGVRWIKENKERIETALTGVKTPQDRLVEDRRLKILINSTAFRKFLEHGEKILISPAEFAESLVCTVNTKPQIMYERLQQLYSSADILNQEKVKRYLDYCRKQFAKQLNGGSNG